MENLYISISRQEDMDIKKVYIYLSKLLRHCILTKSQSAVIIPAGPIGSPPFEQPCIQRIISNFVFLKYGQLREVHSTKLQFQIFTELAKNLLHCINCWDFESPKVLNIKILINLIYCYFYSNQDRKESVSNEEASSYKINYTRQIIFLASNIAYALR
jgi:histone acetyltransferase